MNTFAFAHAATAPAASARVAMPLAAIPLRLARPAPATIVSEIDAVAALAADCLRLEVETAPKPGLVSAVDTGSHSDMNIHTFHRSIAAIRPYLRELVEAGAAGSPMSRLRLIGMAAEAAMLEATGGVNTHRGAIFGLGLLCAAAGARLKTPSETASLGQIVARRWGRDIVAGPKKSDSHGQQAVRRYGVGGASAEAARGFPTIYEVGLPALRTGTMLSQGDAEAARVQCCFALIAQMHDTNLLHRGGSKGLLFAQQSTRQFFDAGGVGAPQWRLHAQAVHRAFVARWLSPGGSADLLAMCLFVQTFETGEM